ncbi:MAG: hypothetical protein KJO46_03210 [Gammaproteobacteria bacterium]|nr:hypothetical protein [Gammaproteobacteria bacterium]
MMRFVAIDRSSYDTWRMRIALIILLLAGLTLLPARSDAFDIEQALRAQHAQYTGETDFSVTQNGGMTLSEATEAVRRRTNGRVVGAQTRFEGGREVHYIKVLTKDGKVKTHRVNGRRR